MSTIFTRIIQGEIPGVFVWKDDICVSFLSINPLTKGHVLVVPIEEIDHWIDLPDRTRDRMFDVAQKIARAISEAFRPVKVGLMIAGLEVDHCHIHVTPIWDPHDLDFARAASSVSQEELAEAADKIRDRLRAAGLSGVSD